MSDDTAKRSPHLATACIIKSGDQFFSGSMASHSGQWVPRYTCPACGRQMRMPSNYLGAGGQLVCTGNRFWKPHEQTIGRLGQENIRHLLKASPKP
jgi:hypothetical protein